MQLAGTTIRIACNQSARDSFVNALGGLPPTLPRAGSVRMPCAIFLDDPGVAANLLTDLGNLVSAHCVMRAGNAAGAVLFEQALPAAQFNPALTFEQWTAHAAAHFEFALTPTDTNLTVPGPLHIAIGVTSAGGDDIPLVFCSTARVRDYGIFNAAAPASPDYTSWSKAESDARYVAASLLSFDPGVTSVGDGAPNALEALPTTGLSLPTLRTVYVGGVLTDWLLVAGTDNTDSGHQRPADYNASTNAKVWVRLR